MRRFAFSMATAMCLSGPLQAQSTQDPAILVADNVYVTTDRKLVAEGQVEAYQGTTKLTASRIVYDQETGTLAIEGPIRIEDDRGVIVLASAAELDETLQNGLLTGARIVFNEQVQLASTQMTRTGGRYSQLYKTAVTSCHVCGDDTPPLWSIRAARVIHDEDEKQLYFEDAQLQIMSVPVFYFPRLRLPDPTLERARGFLIPEIQTTTQLDTGIKLPYFIPLGDHADVTLTPYISPNTRTLDFAYRQSFWNGDIEFEGALTRDDLIPGDTRGYLFGEGEFDLRNRFKLEFDIALTSDDAYLNVYDISDDDRLSRELSLTRSERDTYFNATITDYTSLRDSEEDELLPTHILDLRYEQRLFPEVLGGELRSTLIGHAHARDSTADIDGRDMARASAELTYLRTEIFNNGLRTDYQAQIAADYFGIRQDSTVPGTVGVVTPAAAVKLSYPMIRAGRSATHMLEPIAQLAWSDVSNDSVPNDESNLVEFDEGNLFDLSRFPAEDRREDGLVFAYGMNWTRTAHDGRWGAYATLGHILRQEAGDDFSSSSGLAGTSSDFLLAGQVLYGNDMTLTARSIFDESFDFAKAELRGSWSTDRGSLSGTYLWLDADATEDRTTDAHEIYFDGSYDINSRWTASANWRYDIADASPTEAGIGLSYTNECVEIALTIDRSYTSSTTVEPSTVFGFTISLRGFGTADGAERYASTCKTS